MKLFKIIRKSQKGQASVEYILMMVVVVATAVGFFKRMDGYLVSNPDSIINVYLSSFEDMFGADHSGLNLKYKRFHIRR